MPHPSLRRGPAPRRFDHGKPIAAIDTRPMLFVALFIAVVFLLAASQTRQHALLVSFPVSSDNTGLPVEPPPFYRITLLENGQLKINGRPADVEELRVWLEAVKSATPRPEIVFEPAANAPYEASLQSLGLIWRAGLINAQFCFAGLEKHRDFGRSGRSDPPKPQPDAAPRHAPDSEPIFPQGCTPAPVP